MPPLTSPVMPVAGVDPVGAGVGEGAGVWVVLN
jgi:hypothetical protein